MRIIFLAVVIAFLGGCSAAQIKADVETKIVHDVAVQVSPVLIPDLQNQVTVANVNNDPSGAECATVTIQLVQAIIATPVPGATAGKCSDPLQFYNPTTQKCQLGVATSIEAQRLSAKAPVASPLRLPDYWIKGCAVVYNDMKITAAQFLEKLGLDLSIFGLGGNLGATAAIDAVRAAQAAALHP